MYSWTTPPPKKNILYIHAIRTLTAYLICAAQSPFFFPQNVVYFIILSVVVRVMWMFHIKGGLNSEFYVLLTVHFGTVLVNNQLDTQFFFLICLFQFPTCFEQSCAHHQESIVSIPSIPAYQTVTYTE